MKKSQLILFCLVTEILLIACVAAANLSANPIHYFVCYNLLYGLIISVLVPLWVIRREKSTLRAVGVRPLGKRQILVLICFVLFSVGGQLIPLAVAGQRVPWERLSMGVVPL